MPLIGFPFEMQADWIRASGSEWQSPWGNPGWEEIGGRLLLPFPPYLYVFVFVQSFFYAYLFALAGVLLVMLTRSWRTADLVPAAVMGLWLTLSLRHLRAVADAVLLIAPFVAAALRSPWWQARRWPGLIDLVLTCGLALTSLQDTVYGWNWHGEWHSDRVSCVAAIIERHGLSGRLFAGGLNQWLLHRFHPRVRVERA
jgi:hypothetical protein